MLGAFPGPWHPGCQAGFTWSVSNPPFYYCHPLTQSGFKASPKQTAKGRATPQMLPRDQKECWTPRTQNHFNQFNPQHCSHFKLQSLNFSILISTHLTWSKSFLVSRRACTSSSNATNSHCLHSRLAHPQTPCRHSCVRRPQQLSPASTDKAEPRSAFAP